MSTLPYLHRKASGSCSRSSHGCRLFQSDPPPARSLRQLLHIYSASSSSSLPLFRKASDLHFFPAFCLFPSFDSFFVCLCIPTDRFSGRKHERFFWIISWFLSVLKHLRFFRAFIVWFFSPLQVRIFCTNLSTVRVL